MVAQPKDKTDEELLNGICIRGGLQGYMSSENLDPTKPSDVAKAGKFISNFRTACQAEYETKQVLEEALREKAMATEKLVGRVEPGGEEHAIPILGKAKYSHSEKVRFTPGKFSWILG